MSELLVKCSTALEFVTTFLQLNVSSVIESVGMSRFDEWGNSASVKKTDQLPWS
jgi:hypothetical protein